MPHSTSHIYALDAAKLLLLCAAPETIHESAEEGHESAAGADAEEEDYSMTPEQLETRLQALLDTCTYTVFSYTRRWVAFQSGNLTG